MSNVATRCLTDDEMQGLLDGRLPAESAEPLVAHLQGCTECARVFEARAAHWSLADLANTARVDAGGATLALKQRLAAVRPEVTAAAADSAVIPRPTPTIPGIVDLEPIGRGGMGMVYRGRDLKLDRLVAVKVLWAWAPLSDSARQRAEREALMLGRLHHPNVVAIHAAGEAEGTPYLVMEWVAGPTLQKQVDAGPCPPREAARIARDLARALERVHALGIIHRDIKPDNVLTASDDGGPSIPKLADFGLARPEEVGEHLTRADDVLGTPAYMAPEQTGLAPALGEVSAATDIHGLGSVLFAMLTGRAPYRAGTSLESMQRAARGDVDRGLLTGRVPVDLRTITDKCLEREPERRYRSAGELADDLERFLEGRPVLARPVSLPERLAKWAWRRPWAAMVAGLAVAVVVLAIGGTAYHVVELERANEQTTRSRDQAQEALDVAQRSMARLTGESVKRMLLRGGALDAGDQDYLRQVRDEFLAWPLGNAPAKALWFRLHGLRRIAGLFFDVNQYEDALACQQGELVTLDELERVIPGDPDVLRARLDAHYRLRYSLYHLDRDEEAVASARTSIRLLEAAPADFPWRERDLVAATLQLGIFLHEHGQAAEGAPLVDKALESLRGLRERLPHDVHLAVMETNGLWDAQLCAFNAGRHDERRRRLERLVAVAERALDTFDEERSSFTHSFGIGLAQLANLALAEGQIAEALAHAEHRRSLCRAFIGDLTAIDRVHAETIEAEIVVSQIHREQGRHAEAAAVLDDAVALAERCMDAEAAVYDHAVLAGRALLNRAGLFVETGDIGSAERLWQRTIVVLEPWVGHQMRSQDAEVLVNAAREHLAVVRGPATDPVVADAVP